MSLAGRLAAAFAAAAVLQAAAQPLPPEVDAALARQRVPREALAAFVADVDGAAAPRLAFRADEAVNPASVAKLATTFAALELLGPAFSWTTPVYVDGTLTSDGVLQGNVYLKGQGDPSLVVERLWLLLRRVQGLGIRTIRGDIVIDRFAFDVPVQDAAAFDGEPLRPYNAAPDALLVNFKSVVMTFTPLADGVHVHVEPPLAGVQVPAMVAAGSGTCGDWRTSLKADVASGARIAFAGRYPVSCGERSWPLAWPDARGFAGRAIGGMWAQLGGVLQGRVREGTVPVGLAPAFDFRSPTLAEVIRDINKYSNNVMAQQVFLTLSLQRHGRGTFDGSRAVLSGWWRERIGGDSVPAFTNGSGLAREERITARELARLLQVAWASPLMPELAASLPLAGVDGTLRRAKGKILAAAHLKTGSLRDVAGVAGFVETASGKRRIVVAIVNHPQAGAARTAIDALIDWAASQP